MLANRTVLLGVTGGIAAYKAVELLRLLKKDGADVTVVMTENAKRFVGPATFQALSGRPVADDLWACHPGSPIEHLALAHDAELIIVAPATANVLAKMAAGIADDLLGTLLLAATCPVLVAPAMNTRMILHPATQANLATLAARGVHTVPAESGALAAEDAGYGRLAAVETIHAQARTLLLGPRELAGRRVLVTAGPTREQLDPVRFFSNRSSGKMGLAVAAAARNRGAAVTLVTGPISLPSPAGVDIVPVVTAEQMREAVLARLDGADVVVMAAAVADYRPSSPRAEKIKKAACGNLVVELEPTPDILAEIGARRGQRILVGFAAETGDPTAAARQKLAGKNLDLVVANDVTLPGAGFDTDTNQVEIFTRDGRHVAVPLSPKTLVAERIIDEVVALLGRRDSRTGNPVPKSPISPVRRATCSGECARAAGLASSRRRRIRRHPPDNRRPASRNRRSGSARPTQPCNRLLQPRRRCRRRGTWMSRSPGFRSSRSPRRSAPAQNVPCTPRGRSPSPARATRRPVSCLSARRPGRTRTGRAARSSGKQASCSTR